MAGLLFNKKLLLVVCALLFFTMGANAYESSFPFPFEFGHSSDIYLNVKNKETKEIRQERQAAIDLINEAGISRNPMEFIRYIKKNDLKAIKLLLDAGFNPNTAINANYPVYYAAKYDKKQVMYLLLKAGANPNKDLSSPLRFAILNKNYDMANMLIEYGANVNYEDLWKDETLLYTALKKKQYDIAALLIKNGAKVDVKSFNYIKKKKLENKLMMVLNWLFFPQRLNNFIKGD